MRRGRARRSDCGGEKDIKAGDGLSEVSARGENNQSGICLRRKGDGKNNYTTDGCGTVAPRSQRTRRKEVRGGVRWRNGNEKRRISIASKCTRCLARMSLILMGRAEASPPHALHLKALIVRCASLSHERVIPTLGQ